MKTLLIRLISSPFFSVGTHNPVGANGRSPLQTCGGVIFLLPARLPILILGAIAGIGLSWSQISVAQTSGLRITVNSPLDGPVQPDDALTLREAIEIAHGRIAIADLSPAEQAQVVPTPGEDALWIGFDLPAEATTIYLTELLPPLTVPGLHLDGTSQPGYGPSLAELPEIPIPLVSLTPAAGVEVFRGLTVAGPEVTIRGLSLYGFWAAARSTLTTPPADIFIASAPPPADAGPATPPLELFDLENPELAPTGIVVEHNWLGVTPTGAIPEQRSAFGVSVFNGTNVRVSENLIQHHEGSGVITGYRAQGLQLVGNAILGNGVAGMPDAIRLEGAIQGTEITNNLICGNDGSGIFMFKPEGSALIQGNDIRFNGRRYQRAAVYVMGSNHQILDNRIGYQPGPGVAIAAHPHSERNIIRNNRFALLDGLSIDLGSRRSSGVQDYQRADGPNPPRDSHHRRWDTANAAINAPEFDSYGFKSDDTPALLVGRADPGSEVDLYWVQESTGVYGPLTAPLATVSVDESGRFEFLWERETGGWISAIATDPQYGTSEPSPLIQVTGPDGIAPSPSGPAPYLAQCLPPPPLDPPGPPPPQQVQLRLQRNIHFALDRSDISPTSAQILDGIAAVMLEYPFLTVELHGHTDPRASAAYNQALSERRARAARDYLARRGIAPERMQIVPFGLTQRRSQGTSRLDYARDRRVEFVFTDTRGLDIILEDQEADIQLE
ncbi:OmpA family protein [Leptolyngbya sp. PCC 6406]|uniref:OmpA family protein n=1 Tax=Leptolyngbya sp. PCC 6406 TaxID=1173264 RepID=UPI0002AC44C6|nr:OmpA family protein [Leptolyngbya sp. PCC 6406]